MKKVRGSEQWKLSQIESWPAIIDVRAPAEYADDHVPGAKNFPVLNDEERQKVGTLFTQHSPFSARKAGAAFVALNIARHLSEHFSHFDQGWRPLVYCWRGGQRSYAMTDVLKQVGWRATQLPGGYKSYRREVLLTLETLPAQLRFIALAGPTGVGKSRLLEHLKARGAQCLLLEEIANHRGSVLGEPLSGKQPAQRRFESLLCRELRHFDPARPVFVEAESRRIGKIQLPDSMFKQLRCAEHLLLEAPRDRRAEFLKKEYAHFLSDLTLLEEALTKLTPFVGKEKITKWLAWHQEGSTEKVIFSLLGEHYDPHYRRSLGKYSRQVPHTTSLTFPEVSEVVLEQASAQILAGLSPEHKT